MEPLVSMGGTFDPVHFGHLRVADAVRRALALDTLSMLPAADPPHRAAPGASAADRLAMVELGCAAFPGLVVDTSELERGGASYTFDTLAAQRARWPGRALAWLTGADAFLGLPTWHRAGEILSLAHIVVAARPGVDLAHGLDGVLARWWKAQGTRDTAALRARPAGSIIALSTPEWPVSATAVREAIPRLPATRGELLGLLPAEVLDYIESRHLYGAPR